MAGIRFRYSYRSFPDAPKTTAIEKIIQQNCNPLVYFSGFLHYLPLACGLALIGERKDTILYGIMGLLSVLIILVGLLGFPAILRTLWNHHHIADQFAVMEIAAGKGLKYPDTQRKLMRRIVAFILIPWLVFALGLGLDAIRPSMYDFRMHNAFSDEEYTEARGNKCTIYLVNEDTYVYNPLPDELIAYNPGQTGYILKVSSKYVLDGYTFDYNIYTYDKTEVPVYVSICTVEWICCETGSVVHTQTIEGYKPTISSPKVNGAYYGDDVLDSWQFHSEIEDTYQLLTGKVV
ncbi:MAG: hypothetical protein J6V25_05940 [Oscillospiraceae bacterium]|nr:hypothetical protein [Oscillospiraceae bacterium]